MKTVQKTTKSANKADRKKLETKRDKLAAEIPNLEKAARKASKKVPSTGEQMFKSEYDRMLRYNSRLIRRLNEHLKQTLSTRDIYALSTLMSQQREVINDLRAISDMSQQVAMLNEQSITPFVSDMTQLITDVYYQLRRLIIETARPKETQFALDQLDHLIKQLGLGLQTGQSDLRQSIETILLGSRDTVKAARKKHR